MSLSFDDADIYEIAHTVFGDILRVNYLIDPRVKGRITFKTVRPISSQNLLPIVSTIFRLNGVSIMEENSLYRIIPLSDINKEPVSVKYGKQSKDLPVFGFSIAQIVPLNFVSTKEMKEILNPFLSPGATITEVPGRSCLIIGDTDENMKRLLQIVEIFDDDIFKEYKVEIFVFKNLSIKDAIEEVRTVFPIFTSNSKDSLKIKYLPIERLNAILVAAPDDQYMDYFRKWVSKIDSVFEGAKPKIYVYPLQNRQAQQVVEIMAQILGEGTSKGSAGATPPPPAANPAPATPPMPGTASPSAPKTSASSAKSFKASSSALVSSDTKFYFDEKNNSMVILALPKDYMFIEDLIKKIDVVPRQVLIEALIVEVTLTDQFNFGVEWWLTNNFSLAKNPNYKGITTTGGAGNFTFDPSNPLSASGFTFAALDSAGVVRGLVQTLSSKSEAKVLSSPEILVSDNHEAKIQVGQKVAIATASTSYAVSTATTPVTSNTIQYVDTGVILTVKPQINDSGLVNMDIKQEVSDVAAGTTANGVVGSPNFTTRNVTTNMVVQDGKSIVLGGMIQEDRNTSSSGIPILSDIPLFGYLFGYKNHNNTRTELMVIITPHVIKTIDQAVSLTEEFKGRLKGLHELLTSDKAGLMPAEKSSKGQSGK